jgi:hypothetical protein
MTGEQRLLIAFEMSQFARELVKARIRQEHPDWPEAQITRELLRLAFLPEPLPSTPAMSIPKYYRGGLTHVAVRGLE